MKFRVFREVSPITRSNKTAVSVVICTWNRASILSDSIESILQQDLKRDRYELIVVDNASTDGTRTLLEQLNANGAGLILVSETRLGLSYARNTGWRTATGEIIVFFDDDCLANRDWLRLLSGTLENLPASVACLGGPVRPIWAKSRPGWLSDGLLSYLGMQDFGPEPLSIRLGQWLCGNNLAVRRSALETVGGLRNDLGRRGAILADGEETEMEERFMTLGMQCRYDPAPAIRHKVELERMTFRWFVRRAFWGGASYGWVGRKGTDAGAVRKSGIANGLKSLFRFDVAMLVCTAARAAGYAYAALRPNPFLEKK